MRHSFMKYELYSLSGWHHRQWRAIRKITARLATINVLFVSALSLLDSHMTRPINSLEILCSPQLLRRLCLPCLRPLTRTSSRAELVAVASCSSEYTPTTTSSLTSASFSSSKKAQSNTHESCRPYIKYWISTKLLILKL